MTAGPELVVAVVLLHVLGATIAVVLFWALLRSDAADGPDDPGEEGGGGGGNDRLRPRRPRSPRGDGGPPLPDAAPARLRLRGPERLAELLPAPARRPSHPPERTPRRAPALR